MRLLRGFFLGLSAITFISATQAVTQSAAPRANSTSRILEKVDENQLITLKGNASGLDPL